MRIKTSLLALFAAFSALASAQFTTGGGEEFVSDPWKQFKLNPKTTIKLDFRNANIDSVVALYSKASGVNIVKDPALTGPITVTSAKAVSLDEAFQILQTVLSLKNYDLKKEGNLLVIRSRGGRGGQGGGMGSGMPNIDFNAIRSEMERNKGELKVYLIKYANATQVARVINDVFATVQDPMQQMMQNLMGGGFGGGMNFGGGGRPGQGGFGGNNNNRGGFGGFGGGNQGRFNPGMMGGFRGFGGQTQSVRASSDDYSNSVIVNAPSGEQRNVENLIKQIDKETDQPLQPKVYKLKFAVASEVAPSIQNVLASNAPKGRGGMGNSNVPIEQRFQQAFRFGSTQAAFGTVVTDNRSNALVVTATDDNHKLVDQVIKELDIEVAYEANTFVFPLSNARADQVSTLLNQAFGSRNGGQNARTGQVGQRNTNSTQNRNNQNNRNNGLGGGNNLGGGGGRLGADSTNSNSMDLDLQDPNAEFGDLETSIGVAQGGGFGQFFGGGQQNRQNTQATGRDAQGRLVPVRDLSGQVSVIADQNTNSLIVVTSPENVELIKGILGQLDRIPEQVMIETIIVEATLDSSSKFGVEWQYANNKPFNQAGGASDTTGTRFNLQNANPALQGFRYTLTGGDLTAFINALKTDTKFKVLSTPRIFTSNNAEAQINISQRVPYVLSSREDVNGNLTFTYAFEDVGIVLTVTPRITSNGYVTMEINQTANDLQGFTDFNAPIINQRQADTTVSVKDGETIVLGGIIRGTVSSTVKKVPLLGDLPILGNLFKTTDKTKVNTELMVFLTPRVVRDEKEARKIREGQMNDLSPDSRNDIKKIIPPPKPDNDNTKSEGTSSAVPKPVKPPTGG